MRAFLTLFMALALGLPAAAQDVLDAARAVNNVKLWANGQSQNAAGAGLDLANLFDQANNNANARLAAAQANVDTTAAALVIALLEVENSRRIKAEVATTVALIAATHDSPFSGTIEGEVPRWAMLALQAADQRLTRAQAVAKQAAEAFHQACAQLDAADGRRIDRGSLDDRGGDDRGASGPINPGAGASSSGSSGAGNCNTNCNTACPMK